VTPEQEERVRLALAAAARAEDEAGAGDGDAETGAPRIPTGVAARLDDVLAELLEDRRTASTAATRPAAAGRTSGRPARETPDDELAARRRGRRRQLLVAAAAIAVIAAAGGVVSRGGLGGGAASDSQASSSSDAGASGSSTGSGSGSAGGSAPSTAPSTAPSPDEAFVAGGVPVLHRARLAYDVRSTLAREAAAGSQDKAARRPDGGTCRAPAAPRGADVIDVRLDGRRATLVALAPRAGVREARVYSCGNGDTPVTVVHVAAP